jgi:hypothetical protein
LSGACCCSAAAAAGAWDDVEIAATQLPAVTVQQLIVQNPDHVIQFIAKKGVVKLGEFKVQVCSQNGPKAFARERVLLANYGSQSSSK